MLMRRQVEGKAGPGVRRRQARSLAMAVYTVLLALLAVFLHSSEALTCWQCNSENDHSCGDPLDTTVNRRFIKDCDPFRQNTASRTQYVCRKFVKTMVGDEKRRVVDRSCVEINEQEHEGPCSVQSLGNPLHLESCQTCNANECNSAPGLAIVSLLTLIPSALLAIKHL